MHNILLRDQKNIAHRMTCPFCCEMATCPEDLNPGYFVTSICCRTSACVGCFYLWMQKQEVSNGVNYGLRQKCPLGAVSGCLEHLAVAFVTNNFKALVASSPPP